MLLPLSLEHAAPGCSTELQDEPLQHQGATGGSSRSALAWGYLLNTGLTPIPEENTCQDKKPTTWKFYYNSLFICLFSQLSAG